MHNFLLFPLNFNISYTAQKKNIIHQVTTMLATSKNVAWRSDDT